MVATDSPASPAFKTMLGDLNLDSYLGAFEEQGYDDLELLQKMSADELKEMFVDIGMKKGHALKLQKCLSVSQETGWPVDMEEGLVSEQLEETEQSVQQPLPTSSMMDSASITDDSYIDPPPAEAELTASPAVEEVQPAQPATPTPEESNPLPANWAAAEDPQTGKIYYYNQQTGATSWELPAADTAAPPASPAASPPATASPAAAAPASTPAEPARRKSKTKRSKRRAVGFGELEEQTPIGFADEKMPTPEPSPMLGSLGAKADKDWSWTGGAAATAPVREQLERQSRTASTFKPPRKRDLAVPFLSAPSYLDGSLPGDRGFDPLGIAKDPDTLMWMREAEIKHSRLAMLAAVGWPVSELLHPAFAESFSTTSLVDLTNGRAPAVLNGGLDQVSVVYWLAVITVAIAAEVVSMASLAQDERASGELGFDPLKLIAPSFSGRDPSWNFDKYQQEKRTQMESELKHGRLAMFAITAYALEEAVTGAPVMQALT